MQIIFATQNPNKLVEIQNQIGDQHEIKSLLDLGLTEELEETQETLEGNALQKARFVFKKFKQACFADDTGLEIESLNGEPGVFSARYGGPEKSFESNMNLVLDKLKGKQNRSAQFRTAIAYINKQGEELIFEGVCRGEILEEKVGEKGFGYDPIFKPEGHLKSFAEMTLNAKNEISHRGLAFSKLIYHLSK
ncbi:MAG: RdgB/HAM1 family non-canonical purine NTP pyrophosphatase [Flavobacteriales bacterium]|nr:RdgB/HAM1 family non-canonical purine NTP pyrophosphatase [Flavobacteriales bacterium]